ncbi:MAG: phosphoribosylformylglycinamidine synthase subunit PurL [Anaerolineae bacterium]|nr:phosphoribosylformylglycinamidine synthase subunit PurL [Anaerolineae bacterium]
MVANPAPQLDGLFRRLGCYGGPVHRDLYRHHSCLLYHGALLPGAADRTSCRFLHAASGRGNFRPDVRRGKRDGGGGRRRNQRHCLSEGEWVEYRIQVFWRSELPDGRAVDLLTQATRLLPTIDRLQVSNLYFLQGDLKPADLERLARELLVDPIVEGYRWRRVTDPPFDPAALVVEVGYHPGVTDPVADNLLRRARLLAIGRLEAVATGMRYTFDGALTPDDLHHIARELLYNDVVQHYTLGPLQPTFVPRAAPSDAVEIVPLRRLDDAALARLSVERVLFLSLAEMQSIRDEFCRLGRDPSDVELETLAQTWSEHCQHKAFKVRIDYTCRGGTARHLPEGAVPAAGAEAIDGLLATYIRAATERLARPWVRSAFVDNAGIVAFDEQYDVSFKVETHNHPSALEPFGGANTGVGGVIRDVIGVSARPIANTDVLCFGPADLPPSAVPDSALHPQRIIRGVVAGIEDYGNKMGIPTVSGAILYDRDYVANPLVYCGCVGLAPRGCHPRDPRPGDLCVALGGRTGRDGLHGATFSSTALTHDTGATVGSVVQIGDPITEKAVLEAVLQARDAGLYSAITDCGAGGFSSAAGEMGQEIGVEIELQDVPLKYPGLQPWEIWLSEAQERMVLAVPPEKLPRLQAICDGLDVELTVIGRFTGDRMLRVRYGGQLAAELAMDFLHDGWTRETMRAVWEPPNHPEPETTPPADLTALLLRLLAHPDVASKESVIRRYDHEVQGATVLKPLVGAASDGPADGVVLRPLVTGGQQGLALGCGINPHYGRLDPYAMSWAAIDEALRNVVCVGADPDRVAILDNFCWGNPRLPDRLGGLVRASQGCHDAALAYGAPFISGKDSLNNEYVDRRGEKRAIPPTLLISSLSIVPDVGAAVTMDSKAAGDWLYAVGETRDELGGSLYYRLQDAQGNCPPAPVPDAIETMRALHRAMRRGLVRACHDPSEGGLGVAAAEMALAGRLGLEFDLAALPRAPDVERDDRALFAESSGRFLVEVAPDDAPAFEQTMAGRPCARIGRVTGDGTFHVRGLAGDEIVKCAVETLRRAWQSHDSENVAATPAAALRGRQAGRPYCTGLTK